MQISVSEMSSFMRCRRKWDLTSPMRRGLMKVGPPDSRLHIGALVHEGLSMHLDMAMEDRYDLDDLMARWRSHADDARVEMRSQWSDKSLGHPMPEEMESEMQESFDTAEEMLERYFEKHGVKHTYGEEMFVLGSEMSFNVPLPDGAHEFVGTFDGLMLNMDTGEIVVLEHKTFADRPNMNHVRMMPQYAAYCWAASMLFPGSSVTSVLYNGISKKSPKEPALTKSGTLSKAKIVTDVETYATAIAKHGLDVSDYEDVLNDLAAQGDRFYAREMFYIPEDEMLSFEEDLENVASDMSNESLRLYPNRDWRGCWDCSVTDLCDTMQKRGNSEHVIKSYYMKSPDRSTYAAQKRDAEPVEGVVSPRMMQFVKAVSDRKEQFDA